MIDNDRKHNTIATYTSATQALNAGVSLSFSITNTIDSLTYTIDGAEYKPLASTQPSGSVAIDTKNNGNITVNITDPDKPDMYMLGETTIKGSMSGYVLESAFIESQALLINT
ncbi:MAG: hypothetical protein LUC37_01990, partial [Prevotella sp.]|nr:hypothetical protein [Prevotella sp.]